MNEREQAFALKLLHRWREFTRDADPSSPMFQRTYVALAAETDDFLRSDVDPPRRYQPPLSRVVANAKALLAHVPDPSPKK